MDTGSCAQCGKAIAHGWRWTPKFITRHTPAVPGDVCQACFDAGSPLARRVQ